MPEFSFEAIDPDGTVERGAVTAESEAAAYELLQSRALTPVRISRAEDGSTPWYLKELTRSSGAALKTQIELAEELSLLFSAKLQLPEILRLLLTNARRGYVKRFAERAHRHVLGGGQLSSAFEAFGTDFSPLFSSVLHAAEATGTEGEALRGLAAVLRQQHKLSQAVGSALIYPAVLGLVSLGVLLIMIFFLAPSLEPVFLSVGQQPPPVLTFFLAVEQSVESNPVWFLLAAILIFSAATALVLSPNLRRRALVRLPLFGGLIKLASTAHAVETLALLTRHKVHLPDALRLAARVSKQEALSELDFDAAAASVETGATAWEAMSLPGRHNDLLVSLVRVGEENNQLPEVLERAAAALSARLTSRTERTLILLTPLITLVVGGLVGALVFVIFDAILSLNDIPI